MNNYKVTAIENFTYTDFRDVVFIEKENYNYNWIYKGDVFLCDKDRYEYLTGNNAKKMVVVKLDGILVEEEKQEVVIDQANKFDIDITKEDLEIKPKKKRTTKKTSKE